MERSCDTRKSMAGRRLLVAYSNSSTFTTTTREYLESLATIPDCEVHYLHVTHNAQPAIDFDRYDAILLSYCARLCFPGYVSEHFMSKVDQFKGVRAISIQDEYDFVENERIGLDRLRPDIVFTCIPADQREKVYPTMRYPHTEFVQVLTGYVPSDSGATGRRVPVAERTIPLGYRGRSLGHRYGNLAHMKQSIGEVFLAESTKRGVLADIAVDEASRIYGDDWYKWLGNCRCVLATESGSNVFDWDGSIAGACAAALANGQNPPADVLQRIAALDREFSMGQISARVFEAALMGTPLAMYRGRYSDAILPDEHYIPIECDHSNMDEVFQRLRDTSELQAMADRAHRDLIESGRFDYEQFVAIIAGRIGAKLAGTPLLTGASNPADLQGGSVDRPLIEMATVMPRSLEVFQARMRAFTARTSTGRIKLALRDLSRNKAIAPLVEWCQRRPYIRGPILWVANGVIRRIYRSVVRRLRRLRAARNVPQ